MDILGDKKEWSTKKYQQCKSAVKWVVKKGTAILVPHRDLKLWKPTPLKHNDFSVIVCSKTAIYDDDDICLDPERGICHLSCLADSIFQRERNYYGFMLPDNDKDIIFILVHIRDLKIRFNNEENPAFNDFLKKLIEGIEENK